MFTRTPLKRGWVLALATHEEALTRIRFEPSSSISRLVRWSKFSIRLILLCSKKSFFRPVSRSRASTLRRMLKETSRTLEVNKDIALWALYETPPMHTALTANYWTSNSVHGCKTTRKLTAAGSGSLSSPDAGSGYHKGPALGERPDYPDFQYV